MKYPELWVGGNAFGVRIENQDDGVLLSWEQADSVWRQLQRLCVDRQVALAQAARGPQPEDL